MFQIVPAIIRLSCVKITLDLADRKSPVVTTASTPEHSKCSAIKYDAKGVKSVNVASIISSQTNLL
ncbi:hypothetical protein D3C86_2240040 [compost metagenome]